jgi:imidazole glycerol-phosphate synthase subunit HisH
MIKIIDYGMGNSGSIGNMLLKLGGDFSIATTPEQLDGASLIILPGVGAFDNGVNKLKERGFDVAIQAAVRNPELKFLGICLGMQLLFDRSAEGTTEGLKLIPGEVVKFRPTSTDVKVPHMGWNQARQVRQGTLLDGVFEGARFYFVHSYHVACNDEWVVCKTHHGYDFPSVVSKDNVYGAQFHPEKSHRFGLELLKRLVEATHGK